MKSGAERTDTWEMMAKDQLEALGPDVISRPQCAVRCVSGVGAPMCG